ncbi:MAG: hypothetical protein IPM77_10730 [Crocinitomicaceae bacterium]|nr:hypothetical protein [Crocinitomicaceae bacterium]
MSKRELSRYLSSLSKKELESQVTELYQRLKEVREFYNFVFNPKEDKMVEEAKFKIAKEYFPPAGRKPKKRRSVAQKHIRNFIKLGVDPVLIADVMLYNIEIAQAGNAEKISNQDSFYKSILNSFDEALDFLNEHQLITKFETRIKKIITETIDQNWINSSAFEMKSEKYL